MDWQTLGLVAGGAAVLGGVAVAYKNNLIFGTHRMLHAYRKSGYQVEPTTDTQNRPVWNIYFPHWRYNSATDQNEPGREYCGKVVRFGMPVIGRAWFYHVGESPTNHTANSAVGQETVRIANSIRQGSVRTQLQPI